MTKHGACLLKNKASSPVWTPYSFLKRPAQPGQGGTNDPIKPFSFLGWQSPPVRRKMAIRCKVTVSFVKSGTRLAGNTPTIRKNG
jgi:hypothetical protein